MTSNTQKSDIRLLEDAELDHVFGGSNPLDAARVIMTVVVGVATVVESATKLVQTAISH